MRRILFATLLVLLAPLAQADDKGVITKPSSNSVAVTIDRLEAILKSKGITIVKRWSHSDGAAKVGMQLRPTELLIFGNPKMGTQFFTSNQVSGLDLPMKVLAWEDEQGKVWIAYNDPAYIADRHGIADRPAVVQKMTGALKKFTDHAATAEK